MNDPDDIMDDAVDGDDRKIAANAPAVLVETGGQANYPAIAHDLLLGRGDPMLHERFQIVAIPEHWNLTDSVVAVVGNDGIAYVLFGGNRKNEESWRPVEKEEGIHLDRSVFDTTLVPSKAEVEAVTTHRKNKRTLIQLFVSNYCKKYYCTAYVVARRVLASDVLYSHLKATSARRSLTSAKFDWKKDSLYAQLMQARKEDPEKILEDRDFELPLLALEKVLGKFEQDPDTEPHFDALRDLVSYLDHQVENRGELVDRLREQVHALQEIQVQTADERVHRLTQQVQTLATMNEERRLKIDRLEQFLLSVGRSHPFSDALWGDIFQRLGPNDSAFKNKLMQQSIAARPAARAAMLAPESPCLDQDDSVSGVYRRGFVRTGQGVPDSA